VHNLDGLLPGGHHEPPEVTLPEPLEDDTEVDGDFRVVGVVVLALELLVPAAVEVVELEVLSLEVLWLEVLRAARLAAECPEYEAAAVAANIPVRPVQPAAAHRVIRDTRRSPWSRLRIRCGVDMRTSVQCPL
jgi:hypothetical protein